MRLYRLRHSPMYRRVRLAVLNRLRTTELLGVRPREGEDDSNGDAKRAHYDSAAETSDRESTGISAQPDSAHSDVPTVSQLVEPSNRPVAQPATLVSGSSNGVGPHSSTDATVALRIDSSESSMLENKEVQVAPSDSRSLSGGTGDSWIASSANVGAPQSRIDAPVAIFFSARGIWR